MNLTLGFEELPQSLGDLAPVAGAKATSPAHSPIPVLVQRFEEAMRQDESPVRALRHQPARAAIYGEFPSGLNPVLRGALLERGIQQLYSHQSAAVEHALAGRNTVVVTPTASGKTLCYNLPVMQAMLNDASARAIYLFPTKALAEDQRLELQRLNDAAGGTLACHTYDGDTPQRCASSHS